MLDSLNQWANLNSDTAYLVGFSIIVGIFYGLFPYKVGLNVATSTGIPFKVINVWGQIKKPHRLGLSLGAVAVFALAHFGLGAPVLALITGGLPIAALVATDYRQMQRDSGEAA